MQTLEKHRKTQKPYDKTHQNAAYLQKNTHDNARYVQETQENARENKARPPTIRVTIRGTIRVTIRATMRVTIKVKPPRLL